MSERTCIVDGCDKRRHVAAGWCGMHYYRVKTHGSPEPELLRHPRQGLLCVIDGCERERYSGKHGWCKLHYGRWRRHGDPHKVLIEMPRGARKNRAPRSELDCAVTGCIRPVLARGWCAAHYQRWSRTGDPGPVEVGYPGSRLTPPVGCAERGCTRRPSAEAGNGLCRMHAGLPSVVPTETCTVDSCDAPHISGGYCVKHRYRVNRYGTPEGAQRRYGMGDAVSYVGAHSRVRDLRGSATLHDCVDCGGQGAHWSYDHLDENDKYEEGKGYYSPNPDRYQSRCVPCHTRFDRTGPGKRKRA